MATNDTFIEAPPDRVFAVLADWRSYGHWVVGSREIRGVDPGFPLAGTRFYHRAGPWPLLVSDHTTVLEADPPNRLVLRANARPFGVAKVDLRLEAENAGTRVTIREGAGSLLSRLVLNPLSDPLVKLRNAESLRRLKDLAEHRPDIGRDAGRYVAAFAGSHDGPGP